MISGLAPLAVSPPQVPDKIVFRMIFEIPFSLESGNMLAVDPPLKKSQDTQRTTVPTTTNGMELGSKSVSFASSFMNCSKAALSSNLSTVA